MRLEVDVAAARHSLRPAVCTGTAAHPGSCGADPPDVAVTQWSGAALVHMKVIGVDTVPVANFEVFALLREDLHRHLRHLVCPERLTSAPLDIHEGLFQDLRQKRIPLPGPCPDFTAALWAYLYHEYQLQVSLVRLLILGTGR